MGDGIGHPIGIERLRTSVAGQPLTLTAEQAHGCRLLIVSQRSSGRCFDQARGALVLSKGFSL